MDFGRYHVSPGGVELFELLVRGEDIETEFGFSGEFSENDARRTKIF